MTVSTSEETFARLELDSYGGVSAFIFRGVQIDAESRGDVDGIIRRHAESTSTSVVLTTRDAAGREESVVYTPLGQTQPYFGPVPQCEEVDESAADAFSAMFDSPAATAVPTQPIVPPQPAPPEPAPAPTSPEQPFPSNPFGDVDLDLSDLDDVHTEPAEPKKEKKQKPVKPKKVRQPRPVQKRTPREPLSRPVKITAAVIAAALVLGAGGFALVQSGLLPGGGSSETTGSPVDVVMGATAEVPGYGSEPVFDIEVPSSAAVTASDRGIVVVNGTYVTIYSAEDGSELYSTKVDKPVTFTIDTTISGKPTLVWRSGDTLYMHVDDEPDRPKEVALPKGASVSSAGETVLITATDGSHSTLDSNGLVDINTPADAQTVMAVDEAGAVTAGFNTPVTIYTPSGRKHHEVELTAPNDNLSLARWVSAGHGRAIVIWSTAPKATHASQPVVVAVHSLDDGRVLSKVSTTQEVTAEAKWVRGQGRDIAVYGPFAFSMEDGSLIADGQSAGVTFTRATGKLISGQSPQGPVIVSGTTAHPSTVGVLAVTNDGAHAIVRDEQTHVRALSATEG